MSENQNTKTDKTNAEEGLTNACCSPWINANKKPLADVCGESYVLFSGYEKTRLFAIRLRNEWEYHIGFLSCDGDVISDAGDHVGRNVSDVDFYQDIDAPLL